ncbi:hypothetical protein EV426DRAFT_575990 [Tirmania nivea]|nr:hypothetical protein EV426DRAFT_575990 [Tirmania nivea]
MAVCVCSGLEARVVSCLAVWGRLSLGVPGRQKNSPGYLREAGAHKPPANLPISQKVAFDISTTQNYKTSLKLVKAQAMWEQRCFLPIRVIEKPSGQKGRLAAECAEMGDKSIAEQRWATGMHVIRSPEKDRVEQWTDGSGVENVGAGIKADPGENLRAYAAVVDAEMFGMHLGWQEGHSAISLDSQGVVARVAQLQCDPHSCDTSSQDHG